MGLHGFDGDIKKLEGKSLVHVTYYRKITGKNILTSVFGEQPSYGVAFA